MPPIARPYLRVSTKEQADSGLGLDAQRAAIQSYYEHRIKPLGLPISGEYIDAAVSGKIPLTDRPAGRRLQLDIDEGDHVVIAKLDRGFRSAIDALVTMDGWSKRGIRIHAIADSLDTATRTGRFMLGIMSQFAQMERELASERTIEALRQKRATGWRPLGRAAVGMKWVGRKGAKKMVADPYEMSVIETIWLWHYKDGHSFDDIWAHMLQQKIRTREGKQWSRSKIVRAFQWRLNQESLNQPLVTSSSPGQTNPPSPSDATPPPV